MSTSVVKILVVDDEPPIRKLLRVGLTAEGYAMVEAANGEGVALSQRKSPISFADPGCPIFPAMSCLSGGGPSLSNCRSSSSSRTDETAPSRR